MRNTSLGCGEGGSEESCVLQACFLLLLGIYLGAAGGLVLLPGGWSSEDGSVWCRSRVQ